MAKHKKSAPAAKKPAAKSVKAAKKKPPVPAKKNESSKSSSDKKSSKPAAKPAKVEAPAKKAAAPVKAAPPEKSGKSTPPMSKAAPVASSKSTPPIATKPAPKSEAALKVAASASRAVEKPGKADARELLRNRILGNKKASKPIAFTLDEVREIAKTVAASTPTVDAAPKGVKPAKAAPAKVDLSKLEKPAQPHFIKAASLADILGFNPKKAQKPQTDVDPEDVPEKFRRYYKLLLDLRSHITEGLNLHTEETLKRSAKDDSGDLSSYGQHMADAGTDTFDRDFALSLVSSEQEALTEIEAAIKRIHDGSYGVCEVTQKPIAKERLLAVPFTRYSAEAQKEIERNRMRTRSAAGLFGELGEEGGKITDDDSGDE